MMLHHPNIRRTLDIDVNFETIILEHCDGIDLLDYLNDYDHSDTVKLFSQLIDAVDYLHTNNIVHLDIKLENIIINPKNNIIKLLIFTSTPFDFISSISSNNAHGSTTTPFPIIEILFFLTIPDGSSLNL